MTNIMPIITEATVTIAGDPSAGIPESQFRVCDLDWDLSVFDPGDVLDAVEDLRKALLTVADIISGGERSSVFLHGFDDRGADANG